MRPIIIMPLLLAVGLAGCTGQTSPDQRRAAGDDLNPSGRPYAGPHGVVSSNPPADFSATPLRCRPDGPGTVCDRSP